MSDMSSQSAAQVTSNVAKVSEMLLKLLKYLMEREEKKPQLELQKIKLKSEKEQVYKTELNKQLEKKGGYVNQKKLNQSGEELQLIPATMSDKNLKEFGQLAKLNKVPFSSWSKKDNAERGTHYIVCRAKDIEKVNDIIETMNANIKLKNVDKALDEINQKVKDGTATEKERKIAEQLQAQKTYLQRDFADQTREKATEKVFKELAGEKVNATMTFEGAMAKFTESNYLNGKTYYACERTNPNNYMEVSSKREEHNDRDFTNTEFKVFRDGKQQRCNEFDHGKFTHYSSADGKNSSESGEKHWENIQAEMKEKGGFTDDIIFFSDREEFEQYQTSYNEHLKQTSTKEKIVQNIKEQEVNEENNFAFETSGEPIDYEGIINTLTERLAAYQVHINEKGQPIRQGKEVTLISPNMVDEKQGLQGEAVRIQGKSYSQRLTNEHIIGTEKLTRKRLDNAKIINIAQQVNTFKEMAEMQADIELKKADIQELTETINGNQKGTENWKEKVAEIKTAEITLQTAQKELSEMQKIYSDLREQVQKLVKDEKDLNSIENIISIQNARERITDKDHRELERTTFKESTHREEEVKVDENFTQDLESWEHDIQNDMDKDIDSNNINNSISEHENNINIETPKVDIDDTEH